MRDVTMKDIAAVVGVDPSTVSRALDPTKAHLVRAETLERIHATAKNMGYRGDRMAGALRRGSTGTAGVVVPDLANPFIAPAIHGIARALMPWQLVPIVVDTNDDHDELVANLEHLMSRRVDVVIVAAARYGDSDYLEEAARHTPLVLAIRGIPSSSLPQVLHDDHAGGRLAAEHLIELGHRRMVQLAGPLDVGNFDARHEGFATACEAAGVEVVSLTDTVDRPTRENGERLARLLLATHGDDMPSGVFAHNDLMAMGALSALRDAGLRCPQDFSLVGYNNTLEMDLVDPAMTTVRYPSAEIGPHGRIARRQHDPGGRDRSTPP